MPGDRPLGGKKLVEDAAGAIVWVEHLGPAEGASVTVTSGDETMTTPLK